MLSSFSIAVKRRRREVLSVFFPGLSASLSIFFMSVCKYVDMSMYVCVWEGERERETDRQTDRQTADRQTECMRVPECMHANDSVYLCTCMRVPGCMHANDSVYLCICMCLFIPQFSSVQDGIYVLRKAQIYTPPHLSEVSPMLPLKKLQCSSDWRWLKAPMN